MPDNWWGGHDRLRYVAGMNPEVAAIMEQQLGWLYRIDTYWLDDGLYQLAEIGSGSTEALRVAVALPWVQDGTTTGMETSVLLSIAQISSPERDGGPESAMRLMGMPLLQGDIDEGVARAVSALASHRKSETLQLLLDAGDARGGFSAADTDVLSMTGPLQSRPDLARIVFDERQTVLLRRDIQTQLSTNLRLSVLWPGDGASVAKATETLDIAEDAVRLYEDFMRVPFPNSNPLVLVADVDRNRGFRSYYGTGVDPDIHNDQYVIPHELAHYYWPWAPPWIAEGGATFLDGLYAQRVLGAPPRQNRGCSAANNLTEWEQLPSEIQRANRICYYHLGEALYLDLYRALGDDAFRDAWALYYTGLRDFGTDRDDGTFEHCREQHYLEGICYTRSVFQEHIPPEQAAIAREVLARHFPEYRG